MAQFGGRGNRGSTDSTDSTDRDELRGGFARRWLTQVVLEPPGLVLGVAFALYSMWALRGWGDLAARPAAPESGGLDPDFRGLIRQGASEHDLREPRPNLQELRDTPHRRVLVTEAPTSAADGDVAATVEPQATERVGPVGELRRCQGERAPRASRSSTEAASW